MVDPREIIGQLEAYKLYLTSFQEQWGGGIKSIILEDIIFTDEEIAMWRNVE